MQPIYTMWRANIIWENIIQTNSENISQKVYSLMKLLNLLYEQSLKSPPPVVSCNN